MTIHTDRLREAMRAIANEIILDHSRNFEHDHGIIALVDVVLSADKSYADFMVFGQGDNKELLHFLAPNAKTIHAKISKDL